MVCFRHDQSRHAATATRPSRQHSGHGVVEGSRLPLSCGQHRLPGNPRHSRASGTRQDACRNLAAGDCGSLSAHRSPGSEERTALKMELGWLRERVPAEPALLRTRLDRLTSIVDQSVIDLQRIAADLRPMILDELGLVSAVQWLTQNFTERSDLTIELSFDREDVTYASDVSTAAFRIVQEALTNIVRHSRATLATLAVRHADGALQLEISDNGQGIDLTQSKRKQLGLLGMRERAHMLGGSMEMESVRGQGTRIHVRLPLTADAPVGATAP